MNLPRAIFWLLFCLWLLSCGGTPIGSGRLNTLAVKVVYVGTEPNCTPYQGLRPQSIFEDSMRELVPQFAVPAFDMCAAPMRLPSQPPYDTAKIVALAKQVRAQSSGELLAFVFDDSQVKDGVVQVGVAGAHYLDYGVLGLYMPVIDVPGDPAATSVALVMTLTHEVGHVIGLVGQNLTQVNHHADPQFPGHCKNRACVMFWSRNTNDIMRINPAGGNALFDADCVADAYGLKDLYRRW